MNKAEAKSLLEATVSELRKLSYNELRNYETAVAKEIESETGKTYQTEIQAFIDDRKKQTLRVVVSIDDGGWRAFFPMTSAFIVAPDGTFVGK